MRSGLELRHGDMNLAQIMAESASDKPHEFCPLCMVVALAIASLASVA